MNINSEEKELLYLQIVGSITFIITISISIILTYNNILGINNKRKLFDQKKENSITIINRFTITIVAILFTYISYKFYKINKRTNTTEISKKELTASIFALISAFILLNTTIENIKRKRDNNDTNIPII